MPAVLITGIRGMLGTAVHRMFAASGWEVFGLDRVPGIPHEGIFTSDIRDSGQIAAIFDKHDFDLVVHCAAAVNVDECEKHPEEARVTNVTATGVLSDLSRRHGARFVFISTDAVFSGGEQGAYHEDSTTGPQNVYGLTKLEAEALVTATDPGAMILRTNIIGWNPGRKKSLAEWVIDNLETGTSIGMFTDVVFCPLYVGELSRVILGLAERRAAGLFHVVGSTALSKYDFGLSVAREFKLRADLIRPTSVDDFPFAAKRSKNMHLDPGKVEALLGFRMAPCNASVRQMRLDRGFYEELRHADGT